MQHLLYVGYFSQHFEQPLLQSSQRCCKIGRHHYHLHCLTVKGPDYRGKNQGDNTIMGQEQALHVVSSPQPCISSPASTDRENRGNTKLPESLRRLQPSLNRMGRAWHANMPLETDYAAAQGWSMGFQSHTEPLEFNQNNS